jgi:hypothetical protein
MDSITLRSRLLKLLQKSRKASRLYSSVDSSDGSSEPRELQAKQWKLVIGELLHELSTTLESPNPKRVLQQAFSLRDRFYTDFRLSESELKRLQHELVNCSEVGDFTRAMSLSRELVSLKAKLEASQASYHELSEILSRAKAPDTEFIDNQNLVAQSVYNQEHQSQVASNVIPLRQKRVVSAF